MAVQLGYADEEASPDRRLVKSKLGGKPGWLCKDGLPKEADLSCSKCGNLMVFLLQLYAPRSEDESDRRFHRMLYLFACWTCGRDTRVFRCQLPRASRHLPYSIDDESLESEPEIEGLCSVCGLPQETKHLRCENSVKYKFTKAIFREMTIETEPEDLNPSELADSATEMMVMRALEKGPKITEVVDQDDSQGKLEEDSDDDEMRNPWDPEEDAVMDRYILYMSQQAPHVIRYGAEDPFWFSHKGQCESVPDCKHCGAPRKFEFQVQSNFLDWIEENANLELAFGVLAVYTCSQDCGQETFVEDFCWKQRDPTLDVRNTKIL